MGSRLDRITDWEALAEQAGYRVERMSHSAGVGPRQLARYFLTKRKLDPESWLQELCLRRAKEMLMEGKPIKHIAPALGFKHEGNFYRFFRRHTGETPHAYAQARLIDGSGTRIAADGGESTASDWMI